MSLPVRNYNNYYPRYAILLLPGSITLEFKATTNWTTLCVMMGNLACVKVAILTDKEKARPLKFLSA